MSETESTREDGQRVVDVTREFLEQTESEFHDFLASKKAEHLKIDLDIADIVRDMSKLNRLKHFLLEGETRKLTIKASQDEADHFKKVFPAGTDWQITTYE